MYVALHGTESTKALVFSQDGDSRRMRQHPLTGFWSFCSRTSRGWALQREFYYALGSCFGRVLLGFLISCWLPQIETKSHRCRRKVLVYLSAKRIGAYCALFRALSNLSSWGCGECFAKGRMKVGIWFQQIVLLMGFCEICPYSPSYHIVANYLSAKHWLSYIQWVGLGYIRVDPY